MSSPKRKVTQSLAIDGGTAVRSKLLPYGRQNITDDDIRAVVDCLKSDWLTTGPKVGEFEKAFSKQVGARDSVAVANGTAALHAMMFAVGVRPGDEVVVPALTFAASANSVLYLGGKPVFADCESSTLLIDPADVAKKVTAKTKAILAVDFAGQPCDYAALRSLASDRKIALLADGCHALGGRSERGNVGALADLTAFSFHPVKHITTAEGGMVSGFDDKLLKRARLFRNHGITTEFRERHERGQTAYEMTELGFNYRLSDVQCALGMSQLSRIEANVDRRNALAREYGQKLRRLPGLSPLSVRAGVHHAYHLYIVRLDDQWTVSRDEVVRALRAEGIGANVHYAPVFHHPYYERLGYQKGICPQAERAALSVITLPLFPEMTSSDVDDVVAALEKIGAAYHR